MDFYAFMTKIVDQSILYLCIQTFRFSHVSGFKMFIQQFLDLSLSLDFLI